MKRQMGRSLALLSLCAGLLVAVGARSATAATPTSAGAFVPVKSTRVVDTRYGIGVSGVRRAGVTSFALPGIGSNASAVALNITVTMPTAPGYVVAYAHGTDRPGTSNLNFVTGQTIAAHAIVRLGAGDAVDLAVSGPGTVHLVVDLYGYFVDGAAEQPGTLVAVHPTRILDTRPGPSVQPRSTTRVPVAGRGGIPADARTVAATVTVVTPAGAGFVTAYEADSSFPGTSNVNFAPGRTTANLVVTSLGPDGAMNLYLGSFGTADLLVDVVGYYVPGQAVVPGALVKNRPWRIVDTRSPTYSQYGPVAAGTALGVDLPAWGALGAVLNLTVVGATGNGAVSVYTSRDGSLPSTSVLNFARGQTVANLVMTRTMDDKLYLYVRGSGTVHIMVDVLGYAVAPYTSGQGMVSTLNGSTWTAERAVLPPNADVRRQLAYLQQISCPTAGVCTGRHL